MSQSCPPITKLSLRQRQILELIRQGKSNHEIAFELGIGVGTVKQHVVALFRKLKVTSRTMAASMEPQNAVFGCDNSLGNSKDVILERRPCIVLSMVLEKPEPDALRRLHGNMARVAQDAGDIVLSWRGTGCDMILGIEQAEESDPVRALRCAQTIALTHADQGRRGGRLKGALAAGLAVASMFRRGGWSGEAIASSSIVLARHRTTESEPGRLFLDQTFTDLLRVCDASVTLPPLYLPSLEEVAPVDWHPPTENEPIVFREEECRTVMSSLRNSSRKKPIVCLWGEAGVGKSWLCAKLAVLLKEQKQAVTRIQCLPSHASAPFFRIDDRSLLDSVALIHDCFRSVAPAHTSATRKPKGETRLEGPILMLDNAHWLSREMFQGLVSQALQHGFRILSVSRNSPELGASTAYQLRPVKDSAITMHMSAHLKPLAAKTSLVRKASQSLTAMVGGNPFFTRELARSRPLLLTQLNDGHTSHLPLSVVLRVVAHLDSQKLDRRLLRFVSQNPQGMTLKDLALTMGEREDITNEAVGTAIARSVLRFIDSGLIFFSHPMYQRVTHYLGMDI